MKSLVAAVAALAAARHLEDITRIVRQTARKLMQADGVTFVLREGTDCFYADEDAIAPLWKGKRFPMETCISGWAMLNGKSVIISDIYLDARIPHDAYRRTFVKSLMMVPIAVDEPIAAIGAYWAKIHVPTELQHDTLQALANAAALALSNVHLNAHLEHALEREREARRIVEIANKVKDEFLATVSHELRTPLHIIQNWLWHLKRTTGTDKSLGKALDIIERNTNLQTRLVEDLLEVSHSLTGRLRVQPELVELGQICASVIEVCELSTRAKQIRLDFESAGTTHVWGDPDRLQQIIWNLVTNAVKFTPENGWVRLQLLRGPRHACITVEDSGIGIDGSYLPRMFERFTQADPSSTRRFGGLGIGLSIVKELVELHGGTVRAESAGLNQGTKLTVELPIPAIMDQPNSWLTKDKPKHETQNLDGITILLVDDDVDTLNALENVLQHHGASVLRAGSSTEALSVLASHRPAVLVADLSMPGADGLELIESIRNLGAPLDTLPAAVLSAHIASERAERASAAGFQMYIEKPVHPDVFVGHIATLAGRQRVQ